MVLQGSRLPVTLWLCHNEVVVKRREHGSRYGIGTGTRGWLAAPTMGEKYPYRRDATDI